MKPALKNTILLTGKLVLMAFLLALVVKQVHWQDYQVVDASGQVSIRLGLASALLDFTPLPFVLGVIFTLASIFLTAQRWRLLMFIQEIRLDYPSVAKLGFLGEFFNNFLPGSMGGDAVKAFFVIKRGNGKGASLVSIFVDRFAGLCALTILSGTMLLVAFMTGQGEIVDLTMPAISILFIAGAIVVVLVLSLHKGLYESKFLTALIDRLPFSGPINSARKAIHRYRGIGMQGLAVALYSFVGVSLGIFAIMLMGVSLGVHLQWYHYFLYLPLIMIMAAVPITPGGIGVAEELFLYFFGALDDPNKILAMVLFYRLCTLICGLPGALIFLMAGKSSRRRIVAGIQELENEPLESGKVIDE